MGKARNAFFHSRGWLSEFFAGSINILGDCVVRLAQHPAQSLYFSVEHDALLAKIHLGVHEVGVLVKLFIIPCRDTLYAARLFDVALSVVAFEYFVYIFRVHDYTSFACKALNQ